MGMPIALEELVTRCRFFPLCYTVQAPGVVGTGIPPSLGIVIATFNLLTFLPNFHLDAYAMTTRLGGCTTDCATAGRENVCRAWC